MYLCKLDFVKRRNFISGTALGILASALGTDIVFGSKMPKDYRPVGLTEQDPFSLYDKDRRMIVLNDRPLNMEARAHLLDDAVTPNKYMFIRNNGLVPESIDVNNWKIKVDGESVKEAKEYSL